jgi:hypothetical protein
VHAVPGHAEDLGQEQLDQPVVTDHLERELLALRRQADALVRSVLDQAVVGHPLQHRRGRGRGDAQALGHRAGTDGPLLAGLELVDRLGVVLGPLRIAALAVGVVGLRRAHTATSRPVR